jgi:hypothetical protein
MGFKANTSPGPGSYRMPSDFGYYETVKPIKYRSARIRSAPAWKAKRSRSRGVKSRPRTSNTIRGNNAK